MHFQVHICIKRMYIYIYIYIYIRNQKIYVYMSKKTIFFICIYIHNHHVHIYTYSYTFIYLFLYIRNTHNTAVSLSLYISLSLLSLSLSLCLSLAYLSRGIRHTWVGTRAGKVFILRSGWTHYPWLRAETYTYTLFLSLFLGVELSCGVMQAGIQLHLVEPPRRALRHHTPPRCNFGSEWDWWSICPTHSFFQSCGCAGARAGVRAHVRV